MSGIERYRRVQDMHPDVVSIPFGRKRNFRQTAAAIDDSAFLRCFASNGGEDLLRESVLQALAGATQP
jgi:hypothetical protein